MESSSSPQPVRMNLYFISDIFARDPAGIHRYSLEIARRFLKDEQVNLRFVSMGSSSPVLLNANLKRLFGPSATLYDRRDFRGFEFSGMWLKWFMSLHEWFKARVKYGGRSYLKPLREGFKFLRLLEESLLKCTRFVYAEQSSVLFSPYEHAGDLLHSEHKPFLVHVVHDLIPIISPSYFDATSIFRGIFERFPDADLILTVSNHTKLDLIGNHPGVEASRVHSIPIAASEHFLPERDADRLKLVRSKYGIPGDCDYVLSLCTIEPRKNHLRLLQAWAAVFDKLKLKSPKLVLAGSHGWGKSYQKEMGGALKAAESIIMTGYIDDHDLPLLYSDCVFSVYPSLYEGFGLPVLESMKCGRFCLTSDVSSLPEITGPNMILVDPTSVESISEGILRVANDVAYRQELEREALRRSDLFSWDHTYDQTIQQIRSLTTPAAES